MTEKKRRELKRGRITKEGKGTEKSYRGKERIRKLWNRNKRRVGER